MTIMAYTKISYCHMLKIQKRRYKIMPRGDGTGPMGTGPIGSGSGNKTYRLK